MHLILEDAVGAVKLEVARRRKRNRTSEQLIYISILASKENVKAFVGTSVPGVHFCA